MATYEEQIFPDFGELSMSCPPECRVSRQVLPGSDEACSMTVGSGRQCSMLLDVSSPLGAFSRILLGSSHWTNSEEFSYVWNRLDTKFALSAFQLTPLGQNTGDNGCLLWRTPDAHGDRTGQDGEARLANGHALSLNDQTKTPKLWPTPRKEGYDAQEKGHGDLVYEVKNRALWPTPNAGNFNDGETLETWEARREANKAKGINGNGQGIPLAISARLYPTSAERDYWAPNAKPYSERGGGKKGEQLPNFVGGSLNPRFVEQLMGFETGHTDLKRSGTALCRSKPIRSSQQSPN